METIMGIYWSNLEYISLDIIQFSCWFQKNTYNYIPKNDMSHISMYIYPHVSWLNHQISTMAAITDWTEIETQSLRLFYLFGALLPLPGRQITGPGPGQVGSMTSRVVFSPSNMGLFIDFMDLVFITINGKVLSIYNILYIYVLLL